MHYTATISTKNLSDAHIQAASCIDQVDLQALPGFDLGAGGLLRSEPNTWVWNGARVWGRTWVWNGGPAPAAI